MGGLDDGDANGDGNVNGDDLDIWQSQFGTPGAAGSSTPASAIPEPSTLAMIAMALVMRLWRRANSLPGHRL